MDTSLPQHGLSMTRITLVLMGLVCSIFGTTSEPNHNSNVISGGISKPHTHGINPMLKLYADNDRKPSEMRHYNTNTRAKRETSDQNCGPFTYKPGVKRLTHPRGPDDPSRPGESSKYTTNTTCFTTIEAPEPGQVITLTFIDKFEIEGHPQCKNDYLEIRDGKFGYAVPVYKLCGKDFPPTITSSGPYLWLKFKSDDIIEYSGFTIDIDFPAKATSKRIPDSCYKEVTDQTNGIIDSRSSDVKQCREQTIGPLDIQWRIQTADGSQIYLNITTFQLADPNNCSKNSVQIFGSEPNFDHVLGYYCSSVAQPIVTAPETVTKGPGNILYVRMFTDKITSNFSAVFTEFRTADTCNENEFYCLLDGTCIDKNLLCDGVSNCRLRSDEAPEECKGEAQSLMTECKSIMIIFSLILSGIILVLLFKCFRKVYQDQKKINAHRGNLCSLLDMDKTTSQLTLNSKAKDFGPRCLEYENRANEMYRQNVQRKSSSIYSDLLQPGDLNYGWSESAMPILPEDFRIEHKGGSRPTRDFSLREELLRAKSKEESENRDGAQDSQEAECQTRESLLLTDPIPKPGTKFGPKRVVSGLASPSPAAGTPKLFRQTTVPDCSPQSRSGPDSRELSGVTSPFPTTTDVALEILTQSTVQDSSPQTERPTSSGTTRSAPDIIIVSPSQAVEGRR